MALDAPELAPEIKAGRDLVTMHLSMACSHARRSWLGQSKSFLLEHSRFMRMASVASRTRSRHT